MANESVQVEEAQPEIDPRASHTSNGPGFFDRCVSVCGSRDCGKALIIIGGLAIGAALGGVVGSGEGSDLPAYIVLGGFLGVAVGGCVASSGDPCFSP